jgi:hypothetical protein
MKNIQEDLTALKEIIDNAKTNLSTLDGREIELISQLKKNFNVSSVEEGKKELKKLEDKLEKINQTIQDEYNKLKEEYDW